MRRGVDDFHAQSGQARRLRVQGGSPLLQACLSWILQTARVPAVPVITSGVRKVISNENDAPSAAPDGDVEGLEAGVSSAPNRTGRVGEDLIRATGYGDVMEAEPVRGP